MSQKNDPTALFLFILSAIKQCTISPSHTALNITYSNQPSAVTSSFRPSAAVAAGFLRSLARRDRENGDSRRTRTRQEQEQYKTAAPPSRRHNSRTQKKNKITKTQIHLGLAHYTAYVWSSCSFGTLARPESPRLRPLTSSRAAALSACTARDLVRDCLARRDLNEGWGSIRVFQGRLTVSRSWWSPVAVESAASGAAWISCCSSVSLAAAALNQLLPASSDTAVSWVEVADIRAMSRCLSIWWLVDGRLSTTAGMSTSRGGRSPTRDDRSDDRTRLTASRHTRWMCLQSSLCPVQSGQLHRKWCMQHRQSPQR